MKNLFSFWHYQTPEDRTARNIWLGLVIGLGLFSTVSFLVHAPI